MTEIKLPRVICTLLFVGHPVLADVLKGEAGYWSHLSKYCSMANCICDRSEARFASRDLPLLLTRPVMIMPVRMAMMAMTTMSSTRVKPFSFERNGIFMLQL